MRLDAQRDREIAKRKGLAWRTVLATIWLGFCVVLAYFFVDWLFETEYLTYPWFHSRLFIPWEWDNWIIFAGVVLVVVFLMNFILLIGYSLFSPTGRRRPGTASMYSSDPDPDDQRFDYH